MIGSSDGKQYETPLGVSLGKPIPPPETAEGAPEKLIGAFKSSAGTQVPELHVDRIHDVPLAASALHKDGEFYGVAIDKDAPIRPEYDQYIHKHESDEFHYMKDLMTNGLDSKEAYHKAHDHITPMESARVQADLGEKGLEDYKQYWRDVASISSSKDNPNRHPDAHTTTFGLDEAELGRSFKKEAIFRGLKGAGISKTDAQFQPLNPMTPGYTNPGGHGDSQERWFRGAEGKWRQEIPDKGSKLTPDKALAAIKEQKGGAKFVTLEDVLHHPKLYESYPDIKDIKIFTDPSIGLNGAYYDHNANKIVVGPHLSEEGLRSTLLHEIQHAVQDREGFTRGSSVRAVAPYAKQVLDEAGKNPIIQRPKEYTKEQWDEYSRNLHDVTFEGYKHVAGEVEARNVEKRKDYPDLARKIFPPEFTQDYPYEKQLNAPKSSSSEAQSNEGSYSPEKLAKIRLDQLLRDKAATKKSGYDVDSSDYMRYNTEIRKLREFLKE